MVKALVIIFLGVLEPPSKILKGSNEPISNRELIEAARQVLKQVEYRSTGRVYNNQQLGFSYGKCVFSIKLILQQFYEKIECFLWLYLPIFAS